MIPNRSKQTRQRGTRQKGRSQYKVSSLRLVKTKTKGPRCKTVNTVRQRVVNLALHGRAAMVFATSQAKGRKGGGGAFIRQQIQEVWPTLSADEKAKYEDKLVRNKESKTLQRLADDLHGYRIAHTPWNAGSTCFPFRENLLAQYIEAKLVQNPTWKKSPMLCISRAVKKELESMIDDTMVAKCDDLQLALQHYAKNESAIRELVPCWTLHPGICRHIPSYADLNSREGEREIER